MYAPTNNADEEEKNIFYQQVQNVLDKIPKHDIVILMGDWNAKVGDRQRREAKEWERFVELCESNNLAITTTLFPHKDIHKHTWISPDTRTKNPIDHVAVCGKFKRSVLGTRAFRGADINSDHHLVVAKIKLRLCRVVKKANRLRKYNTAKLKVPEVAQKFKIELRNRFSCLADDDANNSDNR